MRKSMPLWKFATEGEHVGYMVHVANPQLWRPAMFHDLPEGWQFDGPRAYPISPVKAPTRSRESGKALAELLVETIVRSARTF